MREPLHRVLGTPQVLFIGVNGVVRAELLAALPDAGLALYLLTRRLPR